MQKPVMAVLIASAFFSLNARSADLIALYQKALANDAQYASARSALAAGEERVPQGLSGLLPVVGINGAVSRASSDAKGGFSPVRQSGNINNYTVSLSQPLFNWGAWQTYEQTKLLRAAAEASFGQAQQDLITRVAQAYFDVLAAQDTLEVTRAQKVATTEQLASAKRNFEVGTQTITDTHEAQAAYDLVVAQEFASVNELENKRTALQVVIGADAGALAPLKPGVTINPPQPPEMAPWVSSAEQFNYGVIAARLGLASSRRDIEKSRAGHYPSVNLLASAGRSNAISNATTTNSVGVSWNVPIFNGFAVNSRVRESIALEDKARNDLEAARRNAAQGARQSYLGVNSGLAQVKALEAAEISSKSALESNKLGYQVGVRINIDVLNAQRQLYATQKDLSKARYDAIVNGLRLKAAAGTLKEDDLVPVNNLLQK